MPVSLLASRADRVRAWALGLALAYGAMRQGAFYADQFRPVVVLVAISVVARMFTRQTFSRYTGLLLGTLALLAAWACVSGLIIDDFKSSLPIGVTAVCLASVVYATSGLTAASRALLTNIILVVGVIVAFTSWVGVAWHYQPWAAPSQALWRGASSLTYANAAAAFLFVPMVVATERWLATRRSAYLITLFVFTVGWIATLSRAAGTALVIALVLIALLMRDRRRILGLWPVAAASAAAAVALLPSLPEHDPAHPVFGIAGIVVALGWLVAYLYGPRRPAVAVGALIVICGIVFIVSSGVSTKAVDGIRSTRVDVQSTDRTDLLRVTWDQFAHNPVLGVGPGQINFDYFNHDGQEVVAEFTHNEYLQLATELGVLGGALSILAVMIFALRAVQPDIRTDAAILALALVAAFAVHSALDFLWHLPELPLFVAAALGTLAERPSPPPADV